MRCQCHYNACMYNKKAELSQRLLCDALYIWVPCLKDTAIELLLFLVFVLLFLLHWLWLFYLFLFTCISDLIYKTCVYYSFTSGLHGVWTQVYGNVCCIWHPLPKEPPRISAYTLYF